MDNAGNIGPQPFVQKSFKPPTGVVNKDKETHTNSDSHKFRNKTEGLAVTKEETQLKRRTAYEKNKILITQLKVQQDQLIKSREADRAVINEQKTVISEHETIISELRQTREENKVVIQRLAATVKIQGEKIKKLENETNK